jgi:hypothetical protein
MPFRQGEQFIVGIHRFKPVYHLHMTRMTAVEDHETAFGIHGLAIQP